MDSHTLTANDFFHCEKSKCKGHRVKVGGPYHGAVNHLLAAHPMDYPLFEAGIPKQGKRPVYFRNIDDDRDVRYEFVGWQPVVRKPTK